MQSIRIPPIRLQNKSVKIAVVVSSCFVVAVLSFLRAIMPKIRGRIVQNPKIMPRIINTFAAVFTKLSPSGNIFYYNTILP